MVDVDNYNENRGIYSPLIEHNGVVCGYWLMGNNTGTRRNYGAYLRRILNGFNCCSLKSSGQTDPHWPGEAELVGTPEERARQVRFDIMVVRHTPGRGGDAAQLTVFRGRD